MYKIKLENRKELINSRKQKEISDIIGVTEQYLSHIFNGNLKCKKAIALALISLKENISINDKRMERFLKYYFTEE